MILFLISFIAGVLTILAPCTLTILPVIVGSSVTGLAEDPKLKSANRRKAITIALSLGVSVILFTFLLKFSSLLINIPQSTWAIISGSIIIIFGLISLFPTVWERIPFVARLNINSNKLIGVGYQKKSFWGDVIMGASLGPVFSTCSPTYFVILATVLPQSFLAGFIDLLAYAVGLSGTVLLVSFAGQKIVDRLGGISDSRGWFKRTLGLIFVFVGLSIILGLDKIAERSILNSGVFDITKIELGLLKYTEKPLDDSENPVSSATSSAPARLILASRGPKAPELVEPNGYINTNGQPVTLAQYRGKKVVLLDIWTYSCINCQRTLPYIKAWYEKYKDQGLEIIGVHTPEFAFEKVKSNVEDAVKGFGILYPVILDNEYKTWSAYGNMYWPRKYLINGNGEIIYDHIGEGSYEETEREIQRALLELNTAKGNTGANVSRDISKPSNGVSVEMGKVQSPEVYFGSHRNHFLANGNAGVSGDQTMILTNDQQRTSGTASTYSDISTNKLYMAGTWNFTDEYAVSRTSAKIVFKYIAKNVYMVASADVPTKISILIDGKKTKELIIQKNILYHLFEGLDYSGHVLEIQSESPGLKVFTFTFG